jgi:hypothetical protein
VSPAKAAINSDWAIAEKLTGAWLPCQASSALQWPAQSNYRLNAEYRLQNSRSDLIRELGCTGSGFNLQRPLHYGDSAFNYLSGAHELNALSP